MIPWLSGTLGNRFNIGSGFFGGNLSRAQVGSQSTALSPTGVVQYYGADVPRFNGTARRLLIEGQRTAQTLQAQNFNASWINDSFNALFQDIGLGPDGATNTWRNNEGTGPIQHTFRQNITVGSGADVLLQAFLVAQDRRYVNLNIFNTALNVAGVQIDTQNWTIATYQIGTGLVRSARIIPVSASHYLVQLVGAIPATTSYDVNILGVPNAGDNGVAFNTFSSNYGMWAMEAGAGAQFSSYIPTTTTALTRGRDVAFLAAQTGARTITGVAMLPQAAPAGVQQIIQSLNDTTDNNQFFITNVAGGSQLQAGRVTAGVSSAAVLGAITPGTAFRFAMIVNGDGTGSALLEGGSWQNITGGPTGLSRARQGSLETAGSEMFGEIGNYRITPGALSQSAAATRMAATPLT